MQLLYVIFSENVLICSILGLAEPLSVNVLREEICLLRSLLLYDQHQRETIGVRNRRLLGKTRYSRILEEQNFALVKISIIVLPIKDS